MSDTKTKNSDAKNNQILFKTKSIQHDYKSLVENYLLSNQN